ncbi:unnamed protein product [Leptidea sinapis]|uniref:Uncharacterized protein n=1 Tax=Leptidea sinapis TaxID=189913 RepID=A0A5E4PV21_9NEOP|nr:unnamed protein product [Leptidea sinapis]
MSESVISSWPEQRSTPLSSIFTTRKIFGCKSEISFLLWKHPIINLTPNLDTVETVNRHSFQFILFKQPKSSNVDTPLRCNIDTYATSSSSCNVTIRPENRKDNNTTRKSVDKEDSPAKQLDHPQENIRTIIREELNIIFKEFQTSMLKTIDKYNKDLLNEIDSIKTSIHFMEQKYVEVVK